MLMLCLVLCMKVDQNLTKVYVLTKQRQLTLTITQETSQNKDSAAQRTSQRDSDKTTSESSRKSSRDRHDSPENKPRKRKYRPRSRSPPYKYVIAIGHYPTYTFSLY